MDRRTALLGAVGLSLGLAPQRSEALLQCSAMYPNGWQRCAAGIDGNVAAYGAQENSQWCWAACISAVFAYYGYSVSQTSIVRDTWGAIVDMPGSPAQIVNDLNSGWVDRHGRQFRAYGDVLSANPITAAQDLANNMPLIIGSQGHAMVLYQLTYDRHMSGNGQVLDAQVMDPWPTSPRFRSMRPDEWYSTSFLVRIRVSPSY